MGVLLNTHLAIYRGSLHVLNFSVTEHQANIKTFIIYGSEVVC